MQNVLGKKKDQQICFPVTLVTEEQVYSTNQSTACLQSVIGKKKKRKTLQLQRFRLKKNDILKFILTNILNVIIILITSFIFICSWTRSLLSVCWRIEEWPAKLFSSNPCRWKTMLTLRTTPKDFGVIFFQLLHSCLTYLSIFSKFAVFGQKKVREISELQ